MKKDKEIRLLLISSLIFSFMMTRCGQHDDSKTAASSVDTVSIQWKDNKAVGVFIPRKLLNDMPDDSAQEWLKVYLTQSEYNQDLLGNYYIVADGIEFRPLVPFTPALEYQVRLKGEPISQFIVPTRKTGGDLPELSVYPTNDTLPENVLKLYVEFTKPMQEGKALDYIRIVKNNKDTLPAVFLDMRPELWNKESNLLTVWFDPGRIKRDLQPNKAMGPPLQKGNKYKLVILPGWPDQDGQTTMFTYLREFVAGSRDSTSPDPAKWRIEVPKPGSDQSVEVLFNESLDYVLIKNAIRILDDKGNAIAGTIDVSDEEKGFNFIPASPWKAGNYMLEVESRLEDYAGNNLNHPFDNDLAQQQTVQKESVKRVFQIR